jgi:hypothetical protein
MNKKPTSETERIHAYRRRAADRRANSILNATTNVSQPGITEADGVVKISFATTVRPISTLGGATQVFGRSRIWIPEYMRPRRKN